MKTVNELTIDFSERENPLTEHEKKELNAILSLKDDVAYDTYLIIANVQTQCFLIDDCDFTWNKECSIEMEEGSGYIKFHIKLNDSQFFTHTLGGKGLSLTISPKKIIFGDEIEFDGYKHLDFYMDFGHMYFSFRKKKRGS